MIPQQANHSVTMLPLVVSPVRVISPEPSWVGVCVEDPGAYGMGAQLLPSG